MSIATSWKALAGVCVLGLAVYAAEDPFAGTWKLNGAKSTLQSSGFGPTGTVRIQPSGNGLMISVDGMYQGQPTKFTYTATLDGTSTTVSGYPQIDAISMQRVNDHTITATGKKDGKTVYTDRRVVSSDGKTMTITRQGTDEQGKAYQATFVLDKQSSGG
jgi:hypothetical protein